MNTGRKINIIAISGSLRSNSSNTNILKAVAKLSPETVAFRIFEGLSDLPHFNPEIEEGTEAVNNFRKLMKQADGVVICTPEYAFGVPGALKNALDWLVSSGELNEKPVAAISASPLGTGGDKALASLLLTLTALGTTMNNNSSLSIPIIGKKMDKAGEVTDNETKQRLKAIMENLVSIIISRPTSF